MDSFGGSGRALFQFQFQIRTRWVTHLDAAAVLTVRSFLWANSIRRQRDARVRTSKRANQMTDLVFLIKRQTANWRSKKSNTAKRSNYWSLDICEVRSTHVRQMNAVTWVMRAAHGENSLAFCGLKLNDTFRSHLMAYRPHFWRFFFLVKDMTTADPVQFHFM